MKIVILRIIHGIISLYFIACLIYLYYAALTSTFDLLLLIAFVSLAIEGFIVFVLNDGDCPLLHIHKAVGDDKSFFELFFKPSLAKKAMPFFALLTWIGVALLVISVAISTISQL